MSRKSESKKDWGISGIGATHQDLNLGCLQRIADATESMAANYNRMRDDRDTWERIARERNSRINRYEYQVRALKGVITRQKKRAALSKVKG